MDSRPYCFQNGHPLGFAVQLRLTPELKQALLNARASGDAVSLRFREEPNREAVLSIGGREYLFSTAPQAGQVEVVEVAPKSKGAVSIASIKQRLALQRTDTDGRSRSAPVSLAGGLLDDRRKRSAVLLDNSRGPGAHPRLATTPEAITRAASQPQPLHGPGGAAGRLSGSTGGAGGSLRPNHGSGPGAPRLGAATADGQQPAAAPPRKAMELPKPRSLQPGGVVPKPLKPRKTPTPPPPELGGPAAAGTACTQLPAADGGRAGGGSGSGGGGASSPVGYGSAAAGGGSGGGSANAGPPAAAAVGAAAAMPVELPRAAVLAARRGDLPLALAALLREQPLTASSLQSRIDAAYRAAGQKPEAREYVKRVIDNCCTMSANRMHLKPDVLQREGPRLDELVSGTSPTAAGDTPSGSAGGAIGGGGGGRGRPGPGQAAALQGAAVKRMASCSPDPRLSPDQDPSPIGPGGRSQDDPAGSGGTAMDDDDEHTHLTQHTGPGAARGSRQQQAAAAAGAKRQKTGAAGGGSSGTAAGQQQQQHRHGQGQWASGPGQAGRGTGGGLDGYDDFDDLADPPAASAPAPAREVSGGRAAGQAHVGRAIAAKATAAAAPTRKVVTAPGGPRGLPSFATGSSASAQVQAAPPRPRPGTDSGFGGAPMSPPTAAAVPIVVAPPKGPGPARTASDDGYGPGTRVTGGGGGGGEGGGGSENTDGRGAAPMGAALGAASPECESGLDPEVLPYADLDLQEEDKDAELYRSYVDWKPEPHAAVQSYEQFKEYEREYCAKFEVYHVLNQKYNEVVRDADAHRVAVESARGAEERRRCILALWRLGASKWRLLEVWKQARRNLHADLGDLRDRVAEFLSRQGAALAT